MKIRKLFKAFAGFFSALFFTAFLSSCSSKIGYGVVLWNIPDRSIADGTIVPVYLKSNISHIYVIGVPDTKEKIEVPLWKITEPVSKRKAEKQASLYSDYEHKYARCVFDGLPIRADKVNTARQVYRLRKGEVIRVLYEGQGQAPSTGKNSLEGKWLRVLTSDGSQGWCFSYNLRLFDINADGSSLEKTEVKKEDGNDAVLQSILSKKWYPENYGSMIAGKRIDLSLMKSSYGFVPAGEDGKVSIVLPDLNVSYSYKSISRNSNGSYRFMGTPVQLTCRNSSFIIVQHTDAKGMPHSYNFISLEADIDELIQQETERVKAEYESLTSLASSFTSSNYGTLKLREENRFEWTGYSALVPSLISRDAKNSGDAILKYLIPNSLKNEWDGVLTLSFDGMAKEINFLYKKENSGIRFTTASVTSLGNAGSASSMVSKSSNPVVIFFNYRQN